MMLINLYVRKICKKVFLRESKPDSFERIAPVHHLFPVSRTNNRGGEKFRKRFMYDVERCTY